MKQLLFSWVAECFSVLIPKIRGDGFLKVPLGHHENFALREISEAAGCDIFGLDGSLDFQVDGAIYHGGHEARAEFASRVLPALEAHYGVSAREISRGDFYRLNPCGKKE